MLGVAVQVGSPPDAAFPHAKDVEDILQQYNTTVDGLTSQEVWRVNHMTVLTQGDISTSPLMRLLLPTLTFILPCSMH